MIKFPLRAEPRTQGGAVLLVADDCELVAEVYSATDAEIAELVRRANAHDALVEALVRIGSYGDHTAGRFLHAHGSYGYFDEPGSVEVARSTLQTLGLEPK